MTGGLMRVLDEAADRSGHPIASTADEALALSALREAACGIAAALRHAGIRSDEPVFVTIRNRPIDLATLLGVWLAGGVAVPVHGAAARTTLDAVREATAARFRLDGTELDAIAPSPPPGRALLSGAALIVFTSGSTGKPKGVVIGHDRFAGKLDVLDALLGFRASDTVVVPLQLTFIFGLWVSLLTIRAGARLLLVPRFSAEAMDRAFAEGGTVLAAVPSMLRTLLAGPRPPGSAVRAVLTGGEPLGGALAGAIQEVFPSAGVFDLYGLTETGSCDFCLHPSDQPAGLGSLGSPTAGVEYRIVGEGGGAVPSGETGELRVRTPFGMLGYLDQPDLTKASFAGEYFKTGDLVRERADGRVELVGRSKEIISRGGNKIAPLEIDDLLASHAEVAAALCAGVADERLGEAIHAAVVLRPGSRLTADALREWARARTERFKVPDAIYFCDALPLGSTGKAARSAVTAMALADQGGSTAQGRGVESKG